MRSNGSKAAARKWMSTSEVMDALGCCRMTVIRMIARGDLTAHTLTGSAGWYRISVASFEKLQARIARANGRRRK